MNNLQTFGICAYCEEESDRLFDPPLITPDSWQYVAEEHGASYWVVPGSSYRGQERFDLVEKDGRDYLRPYEAREWPICWQCWNGHIYPALLPFCVNTPAQIRFNGWRDPEWIEAEETP